MEIPWKFYILEGGECIKIGVTSNLMRRVSSLNGGGVPFSIAARFAIVGSQETVRWIERKSLQTLPGRLRGEWFDANTLSVEKAKKAVMKIAARSPESDGLQYFSDDGLAEVLWEEACRKMGVPPNENILHKRMANGRIRAGRAEQIAETALRTLGYDT